MSRLSLRTLGLRCAAAVGMLAGSVAVPVQAESATSETTDCVYARHIKQFEIIDTETLVLHGKLDKNWLNRLGGRCAGLRDNMVVYLDRYGSQICANDRFKARRRGDIGPAASCRLGAFEPIAAEQLVVLKQTAAVDS